MCNSRLLLRTKGLISSLLQEQTSIYVKNNYKLELLKALMVVNISDLKYKNKFSPYLSFIIKLAQLLQQKRTKIAWSRLQSKKGNLHVQQKICFIKQSYSLRTRRFSIEIKSKNSLVPFRCLKKKAFDYGLIPRFTMSSVGECTKHKIYLLYLLVQIVLIYRRD